ncbi:FYVE zinc finger family protein [Trichomonas vaginalis G3]|uniref:FYVE zinc finger family protein n=1 Tax=Trichomonas vaginalis (strain ATCC PRA-98 / G3) TaxID=412133 RepID=A2FXM9_TRIV3|nr:lipid binding [Trichomonas vaginalis G3]EAX90340.1 FYVE zinc finger family protein [Trichomonas vaginalis G3]KAI5505111.1 lipid binding [Trichomonas vaginalis G3]|eukprot:XP_001303270.1 FYVE zinc finger family protein [Trichomonas vaginalis G3]
MFHPSIFDEISIPEKGLFNEDPPFPLLIEPKELMAAQISGLESTDYFLIDLLKRDSPQVRIVIETYLREREFISTIRYLKDKIVANCIDNFALIPTKLIPPIQNLESIHILLLNALSRILTNPLSDYYIFFNEIIHTVNVVPIHQQYIAKCLEIEPMCQTFSINVDHLEPKSKLFIHLFREPLTYISDIASLVLKASKLISTNRTQEMVEFSNNCKNILMSIDSIPILEKIAKNFLIEPFPIVEPGRRFIKQGTCLKHCRKDVSERIIILFSDFFVYAQPHGGKWMVPAAYHLSKMKIELPKADIHCISIYSPRKSFVLEFKSASEVKSWYDAISNSISNVQAGTDNNFEVAPIWMPDSSTQVCMICHQEHTFFVRRHHCRACGAVACSDCLKYRAIVKGVSPTPVKVCFNCYQKIMNQKSNRISSPTPQPIIQPQRAPASTLPKRSISPPPAISASDNEYYTSSDYVSD